MDCVRVVVESQQWVYRDPVKARDAVAGLRLQITRMQEKTATMQRTADEIERQCAELEVKLAAKAEARRMAKKEQGK